MHRLTLYLGLFFPLALLLSLSLLVLHSVALASAQAQLLFSLLTIGIILLLYRFDYHLLLFSPWPWYVLANFFLLLTLIFGTAARGSLRWLDLGTFSFQPSELAKPLLLLFLASYLTLYQPTTVKRVLIFGLLMGLPTLLIYIQPDLGSALLVVIVTLLSVITAGAKTKHLLVLSLCLLAILPLVYTSLKPYQRARLSSFIDPASDPLGSGYNSLQATIAVGSGRLVGRGLGQGTQSHLRFLPERQTDFIFASLVEELGFIGGSLLLAAYGYLALTLVRAAKQADTDAGSLICLVVAGLIIFQALINIGMNMGLLPITGITLPLVSAGGSSLLSFALMIGLCLSVIRHSGTKPASLEIH